MSGTFLLNNISYIVMLLFVGRLGKTELAAAGLGMKQTIAQFTVYGPVNIFIHPYTHTVDTCTHARRDETYSCIQTHAHTHTTHHALTPRPSGFSVFNLIAYSFGLGLCCALDTFCSQAYGAGAYHRLGIYLQRGIVVFTAYIVRI